MPKIRTLFCLPVLNIQTTSSSHLYFSLFVKSYKLYRKTETVRACVRACVSVCLSVCLSVASHISQKPPFDTVTTSIISMHHV